MGFWPSHARLVGRTAEIRTLAAALDELPHRSRLVAVVGELGIGKSAMLAKLADMARQRGYIVLAGLPPEGARQVLPDSGAPVLTAAGQLGLWVEALDEYVVRLGPGQVRAILGHDYEVLAAVLPSLARLSGGSLPAGGYAAGSQIEWLPLFRAVRRLLHQAAQPGLVVLLDDLEQADEASVELLEYLLRRDLAARLLLAVAYRNHRRVGRLDVLVARALAADRADRIHLKPLSPDETEVLLGDSRTRTRAWRRSLVRASGGNPLYLDALMRSRQRSSELVAEYPAEGALMSELELLSPPARQVAQAAAVVGDRFTPEIVADVADLDEDAVLVGLDELIELDIVRQAGEARVFTFRHALVQQAAYRTASPARRLTAHGRAAATLTRRGASPLDLAPHVERAAHQGDLMAVRLLAKAAAELRPRCPHVEARWLRTALRLLPADGAGGFRLALLVNLARALGRAGILRDSREVLQEVLLLLPRGSGRCRARVVSFCSVIEWLLGHHEQASALLRQELSTTADEQAAAALAIQLVSCELMGGEIDAGRNWAQLALRRAECIGDRSIEAGSMAALAVADCIVGNPGSALGWLDRAVPMVDAMVDSELAERVDTMVWVVWAEISTDRLESALRHLDRALAVVRGTGEDLSLPYMLLPHLITLRRLGRLTEAVQCCEDIIEVAMACGSEELNMLAGIASRWIAVCRDDCPAVPVDSAPAVPTGPVAGWYQAHTTGMLAEVLLAEGDAAGCLAMVDQLGGPDLPKVDARSRIASYEVFARAEAALGRADATMAWVQRADELAERLRLPACRAMTLLARAEALAVTDPRSAAAFAATAADVFVRSGMTVEAARARLTRGTALVAVGDHEHAAMELAVAQASFDACGAQVLSRQAVRQRRRLAGHARGPVDANRGGVGGLTRREREVAKLVSEGLTNRQIAQRLYVTEKTIEMHLSKVFAKLGASSRAAVAGIVAQKGGAAAVDHP